jgi:hypothetical protein
VLRWDQEGLGFLRLISVTFGVDGRPGRRCMKSGASTASVTTRFALCCCRAAASLLWLVAARGWRLRSLSERTFREGWLPVRRFVRSPVVFIEQCRR